jgi:hypothetical protein
MTGQLLLPTGHLRVWVYENDIECSYKNSCADQHFRTTRARLLIAKDALKASKGKDHEKRKKDEQSLRLECREALLAYRVAFSQLPIYRMPTKRGIDEQFEREWKKSRGISLAPMQCRERGDWKVFVGTTVSTVGTTMTVPNASEAPESVPKATSTANAAAEVPANATALNASVAAVGVQAGGNKKKSTKAKKTTLSVTTQINSKKVIIHNINNM